MISGIYNKKNQYHIRLFGIPFVIGNSNSNSNSSSNPRHYRQSSRSPDSGTGYKYVIQNTANSGISPLPGGGHARILMKDQIFFVRGTEKIGNLKQTICDEFAMLMKGIEKYNANEILLFVDGYGMIDDLSDSSILNKTLKSIGVSGSRSGYYILVVITK